MSQRLSVWAASAVVVLASLFSGASWAQLEEVSLLKLSPQEAQRWQEVMNKPVDPGALNATKAALLKEKSMAARFLGDSVNEEKFLREWLPLTSEPFAKWSLRELLWQKGAREEAYRLGEELANEVAWPPIRVNAQVELAFYYLQDQNLKRAGELIAKAGALIRNDFGALPRRGLAPYGIARAEMTYYMGKSQLESRSGQWTQAIESSKLAVAKSKEVLRMINWVTNEDDKSRGREFLLMVQVMHANRLTDAGLYADAEWAFREVFKTAKDYGFSEANMPRYFTQLVDFYNSSGQFRDARYFSQKIESILDAQNYDQQSRYRLAAQAKTNTAMAGMDEWQALIQRIDEQEVARQKSARTYEFDNQARLRGFAYLKAQRYQDAVKQLDSELQGNVESFGETHFYTALTRGLLAQALAKTGQKDEARQAFDKSIRNLTAPESLSGDFAENAIQRKTKRFIFKATCSCCPRRPPAICRPHKPFSRWPTRSVLPACNRP